MKLYTIEELLELIKQCLQKSIVKFIPESDDEYSILIIKECEGTNIYQFTGKGGTENNFEIYASKCILLSSGNEKVVYEKTLKNLNEIYDFCKEIINYWSPYC